MIGRTVVRRPASWKIRRTRAMRSGVGVLSPLLIFVDERPPV